MNATISNNNQSPIISRNISRAYVNPTVKDRRPKWITDSEFQNEIRTLPNDTFDLINQEALREISAGNIPDLRKVCEELYFTFAKANSSYNALQFVPVLKKLELLDPIALQRFITNPKTNHVLIQNQLMKVVLIHWTPGKNGSVHGHPAGGCVFKVLSGSLEEKRYSPDTAQRHVSTSLVHKGGMAYIDDSLAYHAVSNPFITSAVSLHVYTPGIG